MKVEKEVESITVEVDSFEHFTEHALLTSHFSLPPYTPGP